MGKLISENGAGGSKQTKWSWCVPAGLSPVGMNVAMRHITEDGPRFLPTNIDAPHDYRHLQVEYVELPPTEGEIKLGDSMWAWLTKGWTLRPSARRLLETTGLIHDTLAAARFLPISIVPCRSAVFKVAAVDVHVGRSVYVRPYGHKRRTVAWVTAHDDLVELVCLDFPGGPRRFLAEGECLERDWTVPSR